MQPKSRKKLQLARETVRSLKSYELGQIVGGISHATMCNSKDIECPTPTDWGATCNDTSAGNCDSGLSCASQVEGC
jgi:hypothetical protein